MTKILLSFFVMSLILNIFWAKAPLAHIFGIVKLVEMVMFGLLVVKTFSKQDIPVFVRILSFSAIITSVLAVWQYFNQSSVGGLWYFLGERTFNSSTIGISTVNFDQQILRAYGAFPHPNLLGFFLLLSIVFGVFRFSHEKKIWKTFLLFSVSISSIALLLTFSRATILLAIVFAAYAIYSNGKRNIGYVVVGGLACMIALLFFYQQAFLFRGIDFRSVLFEQSFSIFTNNPYFGIGLNNFFVHQADLIKTISPINFQPPHNIFIVALLSLGVLGWWIVPAVFFYAFRKLIRKSRSKNHELREFRRGVMFGLVLIIIIGMFDHFFLTLEQGQIMLALIVGLSFARLKG